MGQLTEVEIFDSLAGNFRLAAEQADDLAKLPAKGPTYARLRETLKLLEGACRQAAMWRGDARWLQVGLYMEECHKRAGGWLRGWRDNSGNKITLRQGDLHPLFVKLAENLRAGARKAEELKTRRTERIGSILPVPLRADHRDTRPVGWRSTASGLVVPTAP